MLPGKWLISVETREDISLRLPLKNWVIINMFVYHFIDPDLGVEIPFKKDGATEKGSIDFEIGDWDNSAILYRRLKKISSRVCLLFLLLVTKKRIAFKSSLIRTFIPWLLNSFDLPNYVSESRKSYTPKLLAGSFGSCFACRGKWLTWGPGFPGW